ncbi:anthranilate synthase component I [Streptantibioticus rubrisoli]|uniref:Anthranilate synthase n=1 Tax=Streptantibioticus rubrisoli TaxID=1387313 RepID=A0ABT1PGM2_9ACTN|nr:anthranilate synthase component I [Streptantibioticus rubrisoli]MCQ4044509.1 anthranilate synthase component I [Streptantibioticus rubrisoli]
MSTLKTSEGRPDGMGADGRWSTAGGVRITRESRRLPDARTARVRLENALDERRGMLVFRGHDRAVGFVDPPVEIAFAGGRLTVRALNERGAVLLPVLRGALDGVLGEPGEVPGGFGGRVLATQAETFAEEDRTRHAGVFSALRALIAAMAAPDDQLLGLYGAFGYDLIFQFEQIELHQPRRPDDRDLVLQLPDEILEFDLRRDEVVRHRYEFATERAHTTGLPRRTSAEPFVPGTTTEPRDHRPGEYAEVVERAKPLFRSGDLFEVVPGQLFRRGCVQPPSELFRRLWQRNPAPHSLLVNLGEGEYLVGASPEMFVRVRHDHGTDGAGLLVDSSPISGTIARGRDALEDAAQVRALLGSLKEESELTMCTDVDRNDKARVCVPGSVRVTGRRTIEMYSALIHTVDHVEGRIRPGLDALDGFLAHLWAVTVTGAPKLAAVEFLEREERSPRRWYGGAVGSVGFDGSLDTVLTLRTIQIRDGVATVRAGATLLHDSSPQDEEAETELKAKALLEVLDPPAPVAPTMAVTRSAPGAGVRILLVDHRDSFVHCLADYLRQTGAEVTTYRSGRHLPLLERELPDLLVLSPGPGRPADFQLAATLKEAERLGLPVFGVCLGLQGLVEHYGGQLGVLDEPVHGKASRVRVTDPDCGLFAGLPQTFEVGRYHSLYAEAAALPEELRVTATADDGVVMALEHVSRPLAAVQFHPESIMTAGGRAGQRVVDNAVAALGRRLLPAPR